MLTPEIAMRRPAHYLLEFGDYPIQNPQPSRCRTRPTTAPPASPPSQAQNNNTMIAGARFRSGKPAERTGEEATNEEAA
jgi:hypothetical protein